MRCLVIIAVCFLAVFVGCDSTYDADNFAETLIDQNLYAGGLDESAIKLSTERMGFDLADYFAYVNELSNDLRLQREVNEELCDLAPEPGDFCDFYYELLDGGPLINLPNSPEFVDGILGMLEEGFSYNDMTLVASTALNQKERKAVSSGDVAERLEGYGITPRSVAALNILMARRSSSSLGDYATEPVEKYLTRLGFELVKPLDSPSPLEDYVKLHLTALENILDESSDPDTAFKYGLDSLDLAENEVSKLDEWLSPWSGITGAVTAEIAWRLKELTEDYKNDNGLTFHLAGNVFEQASRYASSDTKLKPEDAVVLACKDYDLDDPDIEGWGKTAESFNAYLDRIGKPRGINEHTFPRILGMLFNQRGVNALSVKGEELQSYLDEYGAGVEEFDAFLAGLLTDEVKQGKVRQVAGDLDVDLEEALDVYVAKSIADSYLTELRKVIEKYRDDQSTTIPRQELAFLSFITPAQAGNIPQTTPGKELPGFNRKDSTAVEFAIGTIASTRNPGTTGDTISFEYDTVEYYNTPIVHYKLTYIWTEDGERWEITKLIAFTFAWDNGRLVLDHVYELDDFYLRYYVVDWSPGSISVGGKVDPFAAYRMPVYAEGRLLNDENFAAYWLEVFKVENEADAQKLADDYGWTAEDMDKYFEELKADEARADKLIDSISAKDAVAASTLELTLFPDRAFEGLGDLLGGLGELGTELEL